MKDEKKMTAEANTEETEAVGTENESTESIGELDVEAAKAALDPEDEFWIPLWLTRLTPKVRYRCSRGLRPSANAPVCISAQRR